MFIRNWKKEILTIPNLLSLLRLMLIPCYIRIYLNAQTPSDYLTAGVILTLSCITDLLDGMIARKFNMTSTLGKILDPLADKATQLTLLSCLAMRYLFLLPALALLVFKELFQLLAGVYALRNGKMLPGPIPEGKLCTAVLFISQILMVLFPSAGSGVFFLLAAVDTIFIATAFTGYILAYLGQETHLRDLYN